MPLIPQVHGGYYIPHLVIHDDIFRQTLDEWMAPKEHLWRPYVTQLPNTTKGTSCLLQRKLRFMHYLTEEFTSYIEVILLKIHVLPSVNFLLFS